MARRNGTFIDAARDAVSQVLLEWSFGIASSREKKIMAPFVHEYLRASMAEEAARKMQRSQ